MPTPALIKEATVALLRHHAPFSAMATADLEFVAERVRLAYFPVGSLIIDPASGVRVRDLHIIQRGHVRNYNAAVQGDDIVPVERPKELVDDGPRVAGHRQRGGNQERGDVHGEGRPCGARSRRISVANSSTGVWSGSLTK